MERVTLERFYSDPQMLSRIHAQARRERAAMFAALAARFARLAGRVLRGSRMHAAGKRSAHVQARAVQG